MMMQRLLWLSFFLQGTVLVKGLVSLQTSVTLSGPQSTAAYNFLATPTNWPSIVLSSQSVVVPSPAGSDKDKSNTNQTNRQPLRRRDTVKELFGLPAVPPQLLLGIDWTCVVGDARTGILDVRSVEGVQGIATDCRMLFEIENMEGAECAERKSSKNAVQKSERRAPSTTVTLTMEYEPCNILGVLAIPVLVLDNAIAVRVLFPRALRRQQKAQTETDPSTTVTAAPLDDFRLLMGRLYGVAGLAHAADLLLGDSQLLRAAGSSSIGYYDLPLSGQALALLWCGVGPLAWAWSQGPRADLGLVVYGAVEVICAAIVTSSTASSQAIEGPSDLNALANALLVQALVAASWWYSANKRVNESPSP